MEISEEKIYDLYAECEDALPPPLRLYTRRFPYTSSPLIVLLLLVLDADPGLQGEEELEVRDVPVLVPVHVLKALLHDRRIPSLDLPLTPAFVERMQHLIPLRGSIPRIAREEQPVDAEVNCGREFRGNP